MNPRKFMSLVELLGDEGGFSRKNISWHWIMLFFAFIFSNFSLSCSVCFPRFFDFEFFLFLFLFVFFPLVLLFLPFCFFLMSVCLYVLHFSILFPSFHSFIIHLLHCFGDLTAFEPSEVHTKQNEGIVVLVAQFCFRTTVRIAQYCPHNRSFEYLHGSLDTALQNNMWVLVFIANMRKELVLLDTLLL